MSDLSLLRSIRSEHHSLGAFVADFTALPKTDSCTKIRQPFEPFGPLSQLRLSFAGLSRLPEVRCVEWIQTDCVRIMGTEV